MKHKLDLLFPMMLWGVLLICSVFTILLGIHFYENTNERISSNYETRTALSYMREKIHQNDAAGAISIGNLDASDSLIIEQTYNDKTYYTYIYAYENALWELMVQDGIEVSPEDGTKIMDVSDFTMREIRPGVFHFSCKNATGKEVSATISSVCR